MCLGISWLGMVWCSCCWEVKNGGLKTVKNGPRVWAFCKIEFPGIQKPVQILTQKMGFFRNPGNRGVGVIWLVGGFKLVWLGGCGLGCLVCSLGVLGVVLYGLGGVWG